MTMYWWCLIVPIW